MLQSLRDKISGWFAVVFLGAIAIVFIFWGVSMPTTSGTYAAKVNGERISIETVRRAWQQREQRLQQMMQGAIPESMLKAQQQAVLDEHIRIQLLTQRTKELGYRTGDEALVKTIQEFPDLQVDGKFSRDRYAVLLREQGRSEPQFERDLRANLGIQQLQQGITDSAFVTPAELSRRHALESEQREMDYAVIPASSFLDAVKVTDAEIQAWYDAHQADYMTPERVDIEYLDLKLADLARQVPIDEEALKTYYEQSKERLTTAERRRGSHILITTEKSDDATALKTAEEVLAKLKAGADFASLAKQYSKDSASAAKGGDLDWATRGMFVGPFEEALFSMKKGELRGPIKTQFGYHVLRLDDTEGGQTKSFAEARTELETTYKQDKAQALFYERSQKLADDSFSALTELVSVGKSLGVPVQKIIGMTRQGGGELGAEPKIIEAAFRTEAITKGENSPLIALGEDRAVVLRVAAHQPAEKMPLAAVRAQIESTLKEQAASAAAAKRGTELLERLNSGSNWAAATAEAKLATIGKRLIGRTDTTVPPPVQQTTFEVARAEITTAKPVYRGVTMPNGDYAVIAISDVRPGVFDAGTPDSAAKVRQASQTQGNGEFNAYLSEVESHAKIERSSNVFE